MAKAAGASMVHLDVVDGHFAPGITAGQPVIKSIRRTTDLLLDVHLLIERPERYVAEFVAAGADRVSVQPEATKNLHRTLEIIRAHGAKEELFADPAVRPRHQLVERDNQASTRCRPASCRPRRRRGQGA